MSDLPEVRRPNGTVRYVIDYGTGITEDLLVVTREGEPVHGAASSRSGARIIALKEADHRNEIAEIVFAADVQSALDEIAAKIAAKTEAPSNE